MEVLLCGQYSLAAEVYGGSILCRAASVVVPAVARVTLLLCVCWFALPLAVLLGMELTVLGLLIVLPGDRVLVGGWLYFCLYGDSFYVNYTQIAASVRDRFLTVHFSLTPTLASGLLSFLFSGGAFPYKSYIVSRFVRGQGGSDSPLCPPNNPLNPLKRPRGVVGLSWD